MHHFKIHIFRLIKKIHFYFNLWIDLSLKDKRIIDLNAPLTDYIKQRRLLPVTLINYSGFKVFWNKKNLPFFKFKPLSLNNIPEHTKAKPGSANLVGNHVVTAVNIWQDGQCGAKSPFRKFFGKSPINHVFLFNRSLTLISNRETNHSYHPFSK